MSEEKKRNTQLGDASKHFRPGGVLAPIEDRAAYEQQMSALPPDQRTLAEELTRHADLCRYFAENEMQVPPHIVRAVRGVSSLPASERAAQMQAINQELMEYLQSVSEDSEFRM